jgi:hypothetical protein
MSSFPNLVIFFSKSMNFFQIHKKIQNSWIFFKNPQTFFEFLYFLQVRELFWIHDLCLFFKKIEFSCIFIQKSIVDWSTSQPLTEQTKFFLFCVAMWMGQPMAEGACPPKLLTGAEGAD